jgi:hypothetical protein
MTFSEANKTVHKVETQWHHETMVNHGFVPIDKEAIGFVRSYRYSKGDRIISCITGANSDRWKDETTGDGGFWDTLVYHVSKID